MIRFFNTLTGKVEAFHSLREGEVGLYTCGPTVYDYAHIGNFRAFVSEDLLRRFLEFRGYRVRHVMNVTDVDDKTIAGSAREGKGLREFTEFYTEAFLEDLQALNILTPTLQPRATEEITAMLDLIQRLVDGQSAYVSDGSVYYRVSSFPRYGKLSKKNLQGNIQGARVDVDEYDKEEAADFALWKKGKPGEPSWPSPWGEGRPGWHIECSAMSMKYLGCPFDIHAGGEDLIFPHHENEIAQSEAATGGTFVRYWLHCRHLLADGEKMSKSKGNFYTLRDLISRGHDAMAIRYALLGVHYRSPLNFTLAGLESASNAMKDIREYYSSVKDHQVLGRKFAPDHRLKGLLDEVQRGVAEALEDDLNIAKALAHFFTFQGATDARIRAGELSESDWIDLLKFLHGFLSSVLGLVLDAPIPEEVMKKLKHREELRKQRRYDQADDIRKQLTNQGYLVWDEASGTSGIAKIR